MESVPGDLMSTEPVVRLDDHNPPAVRIDTRSDSVAIGLRNQGLDRYNPPVLKPVALISDEEHCPPVTIPSSSETLPPPIKDSNDLGGSETTQTTGSNPPVPKISSGILQQSEKNTPDTQTSDSYNLILKASSGHLQKTSSAHAVTSPDHVAAKPTSPGETMHEMRNPPTLRAAQNIGLAVVGDGGVGKSCLLITYMTGKFPQEGYSNYLAFDYYDQKVATLPGGKRYTVQMYDVQGQEDYDRLRPLCYKEADVFLVCFSVVVPSSFENVAEKWVPEITHHCPKKPFLLVGTHADLRSDTSTSNSLAKRKMEPVSVDEGKRRAKELRAVKYVECSTLTQLCFRRPRMLSRFMMFFVIGRTAERF